MQFWWRLFQVTLVAFSRCRFLLAALALPRSFQPRLWRHFAGAHSDFSSWNRFRFASNLYRFCRYPQRAIVLTTSLARWGDSVTGVNAN